MAEPMSTDINEITSDNGGNTLNTENVNVNTNDQKSNQNQKPQSFAAVVHKYKFPERDQAIVFDATENIKKNDFIVGVGQLIGPKSIIFASRISNNRICIYLSSKDIVNKFITEFKGITLNDKFTAARRLVSPAKRVILSNVSPSIPHQLIEETLKREGLDMVSAITFIGAGLSHPEYKHILSFRRQVYVNIKSDDTLPDSIIIKADNNTFRIFLSTDEMKCFVCKKTGHFANKCPNPNTLNETTVTAEIHTAPNTINDTNIDPQTTHIFQKPSAPDTESAKKTNTASTSESKNRVTCSKKRLATSPTELEKINLVTGLDTDSNTEEEEEAEMQVSSKKKKTTKPRLCKKKKQEEMIPDSEFFPEFENICTNQEINYDTYCDFLTEVKGKQDVVDIAKNLNLNLNVLLKLLIDSTRAVKTNSLKARLKRIIKKLKNQCNDLDSPLLDVSSDFSVSQDYDTEQSENN